MATLIAFLGALGVWFIWIALTHPFVSRLGPTHEGLAEAAARARLEVPTTLTVFETLPLLDRAFGPLLESAAQLLAHLLRRVEADETRIIQAGRPKRYRTVYDLYAWKVLAAVILFCAGLANAIVSGTGFLPLAFGLGVLGLYLPDYHLSQLIQKRREFLRTEMAFVLHRLAIHLAAGRALDMALRQVAEQPGGLFVQELRQAIAEYDVGKSLEQVLRNLSARNPGIDEVDRFVELVLRATSLGQPLAEALQNMGKVMQSQVESAIEARGLATSVQMVLPIGLLVLPATGIVVLGPAIYLAAQYFF